MRATRTGGGFAVAASSPLGLRAHRSRFGRRRDRSSSADMPDDGRSCDRCFVEAEVSRRVFALGQARVARRFPRMSSAHPELVEEECPEGVVLVVPTRGEVAMSTRVL